MTNDQMRLADKHLNAIEEACYHRKFSSARGGKIGIGLLLKQPEDKSLRLPHGYNSIDTEERSWSRVLRASWSSIHSRNRVWGSSRVWKSKDSYTKSMLKSHDTSALSKNSSRTTIPQSYD